MLRVLKKWLLPAIALVALVAVGCQFMKRDKGPPIATVPVVRGDIQKTVTAVGSIQPRDYVDVGTQVSGRVERVYVDINDAVTKGQLIAEIDSRTYESMVRRNEANLERLRAQLLEQKARLALAQKQLERNENLIATNAIAKTTIDELRSAVDVAKAAVASTEAEIRAGQATLDGDRANLSYTKIYSPMDGTVVSQSTLEGQTVNAAQMAPTIVQVANLDVMTVWAQVAEADVGKIKPGMRAYFTTLGDADRKWEGKVRQVQPTPEVENDVVLYNALIDVENPGHELLPKMTVQVFFVLDEALGVPVAPLNAFTQRDGQFAARVLTDKGIEERTVVLGLSNRRVAHVRSGLNIGDKVIVAAAAPAPGFGPPGGGPPMGGRPPQMGPRL